MTLLLSRDLVSRIAVLLFLAAVQYSLVGFSTVHAQTVDHRQYRKVEQQYAAATVALELSTATLDADDQTKEAKTPLAASSGWVQSYKAGYTDHSGRYAGGSENGNQLRRVTRDQLLKSSQ